jgi:predicted ATPase
MDQPLKSCTLGQSTFLASYGVDVGVMCLCSAAHVLWSLGYSDDALKRSRESLTLARELSHPFSLATALLFAGQFDVRRREYRTAQEWAEALIALSDEQGFSLWLAWGTVVRGYALAGQGQEEEGITHMRQGLAAVRATGAEAGRPNALAYLAEAYGKVAETHGKIGQAEEGLSALTEALALVDDSGGRHYEADLYRLKGELTLQSSVRRLESSIPNTQHPTPSTQAEAEECFLKAIEIAKRQQAKSLELRATMSLARLWRQHGKHHDARNVLSEIYNWFTEGFDTQDLQEAKMLLEELIGAE